MENMWKFYFVLLSCLQIVWGNSIEPANYLSAGNKFDTGDILTVMLRHVIELCRQGMIDAQVDNLSVPGVDWIVDNQFVYGVINTTNIHVSNIPDFKLRTLTTDIAKMRAQVDVEFPLIEVTGDYHMGVKVVGIPISFFGSFSLKFSKLEANAAGHLKEGSEGSPNSIQVSNPFRSSFVTLEKVYFTFDGFPGTSNIFKIILIIISLTFIYTLIVMILTWILIGFRRKRRKKKKVKGESYESVRTS